MLFNKQLAVSTPTKSLLTALTFGYILLPNIIFIVGWLKPAYALVFSFSLIFSTYYYFKNGCKIEIICSRKKILLLVIIGGYILYLSGIGEFVPQRFDYEKHNVIFKNLIENSWPVQYSEGQSKEYLCYYLAYYLSVALVAKLIGIRFASQISIIWGGIGIFLCLLWILKILRTNNLMAIIIILFFGQLNYILSKVFSPIISTNLHHFLSAVSWMPNYSLVAFLIFMLVVELAYKQNNLEGVLFILSATILWSPFLIIGFAPYFIYLLCRFRLKGLFTLSNLLGGTTLLIVMALFFIGHKRIENSHGFIWQSFPDSYLYYYLAFIADFFVFYFVILKIKVQNKPFLELLKVSALWILLVPIYQFGLYNDLTTKAVFPVFINLSLAVAYLLTSQSIHHKWVKLLWILFILTTFSPLLYSISPFYHHTKEKSIQRICSFHSPIQTVYDLRGFNRENIGSQYLGNQQSFFFKYLAAAHSWKAPKTEEPLTQIPYYFY